MEEHHRHDAEFSPMRCPMILFGTIAGDANLDHLVERVSTRILPYEVTLSSL